jgi:hypothetical protein
MIIVYNKINFITALTHSFGLDSPYTFSSKSALISMEDLEALFCEISDSLSANLCIVSC